MPLYHQTVPQLEAIQLTQVNMTVYIANYPEATDNGDAYNRQKSAIQDAIKSYGTDHISGVTGKIVRPIEMPPLTTAIKLEMSLFWTFSTPTTVVTTRTVQSELKARAF